MQSQTLIAGKIFHIMRGIGPVRKVVKPAVVGAQCFDTHDSDPTRLHHAYTPQATQPHTLLALGSMAEPYLTQLKELAELWIRADRRVGALECRHFFSGAALYRNGTIAASLTPVGLAFKVPVEVHDELLGSGLASLSAVLPWGTHQTKLCALL